MAKTPQRTVIRPYKTYNFRDKDPVIDMLRTAKDDGSHKPSRISQDSGVSTATLYNWFNGKTRRPQFATVVAVVRAIGAADKLHRLIDNAGFRSRIGHNSRRK